MVDCNKENIQYLSQLCRLELTEKEIETIQESFNKILGYIAQLKEVDGLDLSPYSHMDEQGIDSLREDEVKDVLSRTDFLQNAPNKVAGLITVPDVIKQT